MPILRNFDNLFISPENRYEKIWKKFLHLINTGNEKMISELLYKEELFLEDYYISNAINSFTEDIHYAEMLDAIVALRKCQPYVTNIDLSTNRLVIDTIHNPIIVRKFSDVFPQFAYNKDLYSNDRLGKCHDMALKLAYTLQVKHDIVTGYFHTITSNLKYLHTWIEIDNNGKSPIVIDYTMNAVINKNGYYQFRHIKPLCRIPNDVLKHDLSILIKEPFYKDLNTKEYLVFRDRIMNNLKHNKDFYDREIE